MSTEAEAEGAVTYLDALEIFTRGDVEQVKKIIPQWMAAYNSSDEGGEGDALISSCTPLHLAVQCPRKEVVAAILEFDQPPVPVNATDGHGATALQLAAKAARRDVVKMLLRHGADDLAQDKQGHDALAYAAEPGVAAVLQDHRTEQAHAATAQLFAAARGSDSAKVEQTLEAVASRADVAGRNSDGGTLLHAAVQGGHETLARWAIAEGVDVFARDAHDKSAEAYAADNTRMRELLNQAPMGNARTVQPERAPRLSGSLHKWTNYAGGWKARWFELEDGVLSYYKNQADADSACRGAINLRVAKIGMVGRDRTQFEILGKGSVKYRVKAPDAAIAKQWVHLLNVSKQWALMRLKDTEDPSSPSAPSTEDAVAEDHGAPQRPRTSSLLRSKAADTPTSVRTSTPQSQHMRTQHQRRTSASSARSGNGEARSPRSSQLDGSPSVHSAADSTVESSSESDDEMYSTQLRAQLFIQDRLLEGLRKTEPLSQSSEELARYRNIATQTTAQSRDLVATLDRVYRESSAAWQARMRREQERIDMLADSLRSAVVSSQTLLESVRQKQDTVDQELKHQQNQEEARVPDALAAASSCMSNYGLSAAAPPEDDEEEDFADASDEFFDAVTSVVSLGPSAVQSTTPSPAAEREEALQKDMTLQKGEELPQKGLTTGGEEISQTVSPQDDISLHKKQSRQPTDLTALSGYPAAQTVRTTLPPITHGGPSLNLWSIIKGAIGKDLSKVSVPVFFNEPTSFLQRFTEDMEYSELLELAARLPRSADRTLFVAGFAMSNYASTFGRIAKPFNPLLGETFEYVRRDRKYRALSEQVEHHPPISACWVEGANFVYHADTNIKSKFNSGSLTVVPTGVCHVELRLPLAFLDCPEERNAGDARQSPNINHEEGYFTEHYTWNKLTTNVNGIMLANFWIEHVGDLNVVNHRTGDATKITFMQSGWTGKNKFKVTGESLDRRGQRVYEIAGDWTSRLVARPVGSEASADQAAEPVVYSNDTDHANSASTGDAVGFAAAHIVEVPRKPFVLWKINERPTQDNNYHLTTFAMSLNDKPSGLEPFLCPSDSRFRPDQRAMEVGEYELADREKSRLENKQRATRRRREQGELESWNPRWFEKALDEDSGEEFWRFNGQYWSERERVAEIKKQDENTKNQPSSIELWSGVEDIF